MADIDTPRTEDLPKPSKKPILLAIILGILGAIGGFFASYSGKILTTASAFQTNSLPAEMNPSPEVSFIEIPAILVSLGSNSTNKHLSFKSQLEVPLRYHADVEHLLPRVIDVINSYLRALETEDFDSPTILVRLRSQLLRRIQVVVDQEKVNDLLIMEFVLN
ncbi:MAG: flagellar basal body-associated FliL family protein [Lentilitoribacter sp.]